MAEEPQVTIKDVLNKTEISLILDTYDDIFSDFDPRPYGERTLSEDFLFEARRAVRDKKEGFELNLLIPNNLRNAAQEEKIKHRLKEHFKNHYIQIEDELSAYKKQALLLVFIGIVIGLIEALTLSSPSTFDISALLVDVIGIVLTPASWFSIWTGFDHLIYRPKNLLADESFYMKMQNIHISFTSY